MLTWFIEVYYCICERHKEIHLHYFWKQRSSQNSIDDVSIFHAARVGHSIWKVFLHDITFILQRQVVPYLKKYIEGQNLKFHS